jgi:hypothetical protein
MQLGDQFESIDAAHEAIKAYVLDQGESFKIVSSDKKWYIITYKDHDCKFYIHATRSIKEVVSIIVLKPHSCSPAIHYKSR